MAGLLDYLFSNGSPLAQQAAQAMQGQAPQQAPPQSSSGFGYDPQGYLAPQAPAQAPAGSFLKAAAQASPTSALTQPPQQAQPQAPQGQPQDPNAPITVTGQAKPQDDWQPHKAGLLGQISDYLLGTHFGRENVRRNEVQALQGIDQDPMQAVHRLMQIDPKAGEALYEKITDQQRQGKNLDRQNDVLQLQRDKYLDQQVGNIMYAASQSSNPQAAFQRARARAIEFGGRYGRDYSTLPDQYDPNDVSSYAMGAIPAARQMTNATNVKKEADTNDYRNRNLAERTQYHAGELDVARGGLSVRQAMEGDSNARVGIEQQNANTAAARAKIYAQKNGGQPVQLAPDGSALVPNKDGNTATRFLKDGRKALYIRGPDGHHWKFAHQMIGRDEKAAGVANPNASPDEE